MLEGRDVQLLPPPDIGPHVHGLPHPGAPEVIVPDRPAGQAHPGTLEPQVLPLQHVGPGGDIQAGGGGISSGARVVEGVNPLENGDFIFLQAERSPQVIIAHLAGKLKLGHHNGLPLGELVLPHLLFADIVGNHPLGSTLGGKPGQIPVGRPLPDIVLFQDVNQLGEGGSNPHALLVLHALVALAQGLLDDHGEILLLLLVLGLVQVHEHGDEGRLSVGGHQSDDLVLDGLNAPANLFPQAVFHDFGNGFLRGRNAEDGHFPFHGLADFLPADLDEGGKVGQGNGLSAVLVGRHLGNDLGGNVAGGGEGMGLLDQGAGNDGTVLQHILQIHKIAVVHMLGIVVRVVEMDDAGLVGVHHFLGKQNTAGDVLADLACHVVPLDGVDGGVLVGILLLDLLVVALDQAEDAVVRGIGLAQEAAGVAVGNIFLGHLESAVSHNGLFHQILNFLHGRAAPHFLAGDLHALGNSLDLQRGHTHLFVHRFIGLGHGHIDLINVKNDLCAVTLNNLHGLFLLGTPVHNQFVHGLLYKILWFCQEEITKYGIAAFYIKKFPILPPAADVPHEWESSVFPANRKRRV